MDKEAVNKNSEDFFKALHDKSLEGALDDFEKEALEGWRMVESIDARKTSLQHKAQALFIEEKNKGTSVPLKWISIAASIILVVGLVFYFAPKLNKDNETIVEKTKENKKTEESKIKKDEHSNTQEVYVINDSVFIKNTPDQLENNNSGKDRKVSVNATIVESAINEEMEPKKSAESVSGILKNETVTRNKNISSDDFSAPEAVLSQNQTSSKLSSGSSSYATYDTIISHPLNRDEKVTIINDKSLKVDEVKNEELRMSTRKKKFKSKGVKTDGLATNQGLSDAYDFENSNQIIQLKLKISLIEKSTSKETKSFPEYPGDYQAFENYLLQNFNKKTFEKAESIQFEFQIKSNGKLEIIQTNNEIQLKLYKELERVFQLMPKCIQSNDSHKNRFYLNVTSYY